MAAPKNAVGPKSDKLWRDAIMVAVKREIEAAGGKKTKKLYALADALADKGLKGDVTALKEIGDRLDGKAVQGVELGGPGGGPVETKDVSLTELARRILFLLGAAAEATQD